MSDKYILIGQTPVPVEPCDPYTPEGIAGLIEWARWFENNDCRRVASTRVLDVCRVSTVFLGLDHGFGRLLGRGEPPILFDSMVFWDGESGNEQDRCFTWSEAEAMHAHMVAEVARPRAVLAYVGRRLRTFVGDAREDWRKGWRELRGRGPVRTGDLMLDQALEAMERIRERLRDE